MNYKLHFLVKPQVLFAWDLSAQWTVFKQCHILGRDYRMYEGGSQCQIWFNVVVQPECFWACSHTHCTKPHGDIAWRVEFVYGTYVAYVSCRPIRGKWGLCNWMNGFDVSLQRLTIWFHCTGSSVCQWETVAISLVRMYNFIIRLLHCDPYNFMSPKLIWENCVYM